MTCLTLPLLEALAVIRTLERDALALVALFPGEAVRLAWVTSLLREAVR